MPSAFGANGVVAWCASDKYDDPPSARFATLCRDTSGHTFFATQPSILTGPEEAGHAIQVCWCPAQPERVIVRYRQGCVLCEVRDQSGTPTPETVATWLIGKSCAVACHQSLPIAAVSTAPLDPTVAQ